MSIIRVNIDTDNNYYIDITDGAISGSNLPESILDKIYIEYKMYDEETEEKIKIFFWDESKLLATINQENQVNEVSLLTPEEIDNISKGIKVKINEYFEIEFVDGKIKYSNIPESVILTKGDLVDDFTNINILKNDLEKLGIKVKITEDKELGLYEVRLIDDVTAAHKFSIYNRKQLGKSKKCGCFYCCEIFTPDEITNYLNESEGTALCPHCGIDSVIGDASGYPITKEFMQSMHERWF